VEDRNEWVSATVKRIAPSAQAGSRSVMIYLALNKPAGLRHGLFAKGILGLDRHSVLAVPLSAIRSDRSQPYVQLVEKNGDQFQVVHKTVQMGIRGIDNSQTESEPWVGVTGIDAGSMVLLGQVGSLREGIRVKFTSPLKP